MVNLAQMVSRQLSMCLPCTRSLLAKISLARPFSFLYNDAHHWVGCNMVNSCSRLRVTASHGRLLLYCPVGATIVA